MNTAILSSQPVSLPVLVLAVGQDGKVSDITAAVNCHSTNEDIVKVKWYLCRAHTLQHIKIIISEDTLAVRCMYTRHIR